MSQALANFTHSSTEHHPGSFSYLACRRRWNITQAVGIGSGWNLVSMMVRITLRSSSISPWFSLMLFRVAMYFPSWTFAGNTMSFSMKLFKASWTDWSKVRTASLWTLSRYVPMSSATGFSLGAPGWSDEMLQSMHWRTSLAVNTDAYSMELFPSFPWNTTWYGLSRSWVRLRKMRLSARPSRSRGRRHGIQGDLHRPSCGG